MLKTSCLLLGFTLSIFFFVPFTAWSEDIEIQFSPPQDALGASVRLDRDGDRRTCGGTCLKSSGVSVVATVAHCLTNLHTGGVSLFGASSTKAFVPSSVLRNGQDGDYDDYALVLFPAGTCRTAVSVNFGKRSVGEIVHVAKSGKLATETLQAYNTDGNSEVYASTTNASGLGPGDSGSGAYTSQGEYFGSLRGCLTNDCGFFSAHNANPYSAEVFNKARAAGVFGPVQSNTRVRPKTIVRRSVAQPTEDNSPSRRDEAVDRQRLEEDFQHWVTQHDCRRKGQDPGAQVEYAPYTAPGGWGTTNRWGTGGATHFVCHRCGDWMILPKRFQSLKP